MTENEIKDRIEEYTRRRPPGRVRVFEDTSAFMSITAGDVLLLGGRYFLVQGEETEGRFGLEEQPKFWVKRATDLADGSRKLVKLSFHETFTLRIGGLALECYRSPEKEARILDLTRGDSLFMQGSWVADTAGNPVRILDRITGTPFYAQVNALDLPHAAYFSDVLPGLFCRVVEAVSGIARLHALGEIHGDIRNDHLYLDRETGSFRWIDFDYAYGPTENPYGVDLFGLGNVLLFLTGMGFHNLADITACLPPGAAGEVCLSREDFSLFFPHRVMNLKKIFPHVPESLNQVLMRFSAGSTAFYENAGELLEDLSTASRDLGCGV